MDHSTPINTTQQAEQSQRDHSRPSTPASQAASDITGDERAPYDHHLPNGDDDELTKPGFYRLAEYRTLALQVGFLADLITFYEAKNEPSPSDLLGQARWTFFASVKEHVNDFVCSLGTSCWGTLSKCTSPDDEWEIDRDCLTCNFYDHDFARVPYQIIRDAVHDELSVVKTMKKLWVHWIETVEVGREDIGPDWRTRGRRDTGDRDEVATATKKAWNNLTEIEQTAFMKSFDMDGDKLKGWVAELQTREVEDPAVRTSPEYLDALHKWWLAHMERLDPNQEGLQFYAWSFGELEEEIAHTNRQLRSWYKSLYGIIFRQKGSGHWLQPVTIESVSEDADCPICCAPYGANDSRPVKTYCNHIMCFGCIMHWMNDQQDDETGPNTLPLCPMCRGNLAPPDFDPWSFYHRFHSEGHFLNETEDRPQRHAERLVKDLTEYLDGLYHERPNLEPDLDLALEEFCATILGSQQHALDLMDATFPNPQHPPEEADNRVAHLAIECMYLARDRLVAYLAGDTEAYRKVITRELQLVAWRETIWFLSSLADWIWEEDNNSEWSGDDYSVGSGDNESIATEYADWDASTD